MKKILTIIALLSTPVTATQADLLTVLEGCADQARQLANRHPNCPGSQDWSNDLDSFSNMLVNSTTNYREPEGYIDHINRAAMTQSLWLDLIQYLNEVNNTVSVMGISPSVTAKIQPALEYVRSQAYAF
ncbi:hypothetical protein [Candidatus Odyssella thessalonicensis]|uniref:hypothetical protein n=1 Tax=Candidatus Odyssella thessalonicensis TaxID=84647 RepID=UPI000225B20C|nr:hypothetical protein [Candidatus Odyssella thessalonicensis]